MQNITLLSFITHVAINIFFGLKKRLGLHTNGNPALAGMAFYRNGFLSFLLVSAIVLANIAQFALMVKNNTGQESGYLQLARLLENQKVSAQADQPAFINLAKVDRTSPDEKICGLKIDLAVAKKTENQNNAFINGTLKPAGEPYKIFIADRTESLLDATRQLMVQYIGTDPCLGLAYPAQDKCRLMIAEFIDKQAFKYMQLNGFIISNNSKIPDIGPGTVVILYSSGRMRVF